MSDLITEFSGNTLQEWGQWYRVRKPEAIDEAVEKVYSMVVALKEAIALIDKGMVKEYIEDLLINKTFQGFKIQKSILSFLGKETQMGYKCATSEEESRGIDGYIGNFPVSIKPKSYQSMKGLSEIINVKIIYYEKGKNGVFIEYEPFD